MDAIINITKNFYSKFLYIGDKNSFIIDEINNLFNLNNENEFKSFISTSTILNDESKDFLFQYLRYNKEEREEKEILFLNYFNVSNTPVDKIKILDNILPFNFVNNLIIEKSLIKNLDNFNLFRKEISHIENFILENKNIAEINNLSIFISHNDSNSGEYDKIKNSIKLYSNNLNPSSLYHEFFHLIDNELSKKYHINDLFSNSNTSVKELKLFNSFVSNLDEFILSNHSETFNLYYSKYLGKNANLEIKSLDDIKFKIKNLKYLGFNLIIKKEKEDLFNSLAEEIYSHFQYSQNENNKPKRNLYSIFSDIIDLDLPINKKYISKNSEKLARIYQSSFTIDKDSLYPLGSEKIILTTHLNHILKNEIKPLLAHSNTLNNILSIRANFNKKIKETYSIK